MNFILLSKQETKELEKNVIALGSESIVNILNDKQYRLRIKRNLLLSEWQHSQGVDVNGVKKSWDLLIKLLNTKPTYYANYDCKNAIWGFGWRLDNNIDNKFIIYLSARGLTIEIHPNFEKNMIDNFLDELINTLVNKDNIDPTVKKTL